MEGEGVQQQLQQQATMISSESFMQLKQPVQANASAVNQWYKTRLCAMFSTGHCSKGSKCTFAHGSADLRSGPSLHKTSLCKKFLSAEGCPVPKGDCPFAHGPEDLRCTDDYFKTQLCHFWMVNGTCQAGPKCRHAHGLQELRHRKYMYTNAERKTLLSERQQADDSTLAVARVPLTIKGAVRPPLARLGLGAPPGSADARSDSESSRGGLSSSRKCSQPPSVAPASASVQAAETGNGVFVPHFPPSASGSSRGLAPHHHAEISHHHAEAPQQQQKGDTHSHAHSRGQIPPPAPHHHHVGGDRERPRPPAHPLSHAAAGMQRGGGRQDFSSSSVPEPGGKVHSHVVGIATTNPDVTAAAASSGAALPFAPRVPVDPSSIPLSPSVEQEQMYLDHLSQQQQQQQQSFGGHQGPPQHHPNRSLLQQHGTPALAPAASGSLGANSAELHSSSSVPHSSSFRHDQAAGVGVTADGHQPSSQRHRQGLEALRPSYPSPAAEGGLTVSHSDVGRQQRHGTGSSGDDTGVGRLENFGHGHTFQNIQFDPHSYSNLSAGAADPSPMSSTAPPIPPPPPREENPNLLPPERPLPVPPPSQTQSHGQSLYQARPTPNPPPPHSVSYHGPYPLASQLPVRPPNSPPGHSPPGRPTPSPLPVPGPPSSVAAASTHPSGPPPPPFSSALPHPHDTSSSSSRRGRISDPPDHTPPPPPLALSQTGSAPSTSGKGAGKEGTTRPPHPLSLPPTYHWANSSNHHPNPPTPAPDGTDHPGAPPPPHPPHTQPPQTASSSSNTRTPQVPPPHQWPPPPPPKGPSAPAPGLAPQPAQPPPQQPDPRPPPVSSQALPRPPPPRRGPADAQTTHPQNPTVPPGQPAPAGIGGTAGRSSSSNKKGHFNPEMQPQPNLESPSSPTMVQQQQQHQPPHRPPIAAGTPPLPPSSSHMQQQPQPIESPLLWQRGLGVSAARQALQVASASTYNPLMQQQQQQSQSGVPVPVAAPVAVPGGPAVSPATAPVSAQAVAAAAAAAAAAVVGVGGVGGMYSQEPVPGASHTPQISSPSIMLGSSQPPSAAASLGPPHYLSSPAPAWSSMMSDWIVPVTPGTSRQFGAGPRRSLTLQGLNRTGTGLTALGEGPSSSVTGASPLGQLLSVVSPPQFDHRYAGGAGHWTEKSLRMLEAAGLSELLRQPIDPGPAVPAGGRGAGGGEGTPTPRAVVTSGSASAASVQPAAAQNPTGTLLSAQQQQTFAAASFVPAVLFGHPSQFPQGTAAAAAAAAAAATASQLAPPSAAASGPQSSAAVASAVENVPLQQDDASASAAAAADAALNPVPPLSGSSSNAPEHAASQTGAAHAVPLSSEGQRREEEEEEEDHPTHSSADVRQKRGRGAEQQKSKQPSGSPVEASGGTDREGEGMGVGVGPPESRHIQAPHSTPEVVPETESTVRGGEGGEGDGKRSGNTGDSEKREKENVEKLSGSGTTDSRSLPRVGEKEKHGEESNEEVEVSTTTGCQGNSQSKGDAGAQSATGSGVGVGRRRSSLKALTGVGTSTRQMRKLLLGEACSVGSLSFDSRRESLARVEEKGGDSSSDLPPNSAAAAAQQQQNNTQQNNSPLDSGCLKKTNADDPPTSQSPNPSSSQHQHWQVQDEGMKAADSGDMPAEESKQKEEPEPGAASTPADVVPSAQQAVTLPSNQLAQGAAIHPLQVPFLVTPQPALSQSHVSVPSSAAASITPSAGSMQHQPMAVGATPLGSGSAAGSAAAASGPSVVPSTAAAAAASAATPFSSQQLAGPNNPLAGSTTSPGLHASFVSNGSAGQGQGVGVDGSVQQGGQTAAALSQMVPLASQRVAPLFVFTPTVTSMNAAERFGRRGLSRMPLEALFETPDGTAASAPSPSGSGGDVPVPAGSSASSGAPQPQPARAAVGDPSASQQALAALLQGVDVNSLLQAGGDVGHLMISPQPSRRRLVNMRDVRAGTATVHDLLQDAKSELIEKLAVLRNQEYTD